MLSHGDFFSRVVKNWNRVRSEHVEKKIGCQWLWREQCKKSSSKENFFRVTEEQTEDCKNCTQFSHSWASKNLLDALRESSLQLPHTHVHLTVLLSCNAIKLRWKFSFTRKSYNFRNCDMKSRSSSAFYEWISNFLKCLTASKDTHSKVSMPPILKLNNFPHTTTSHFMDVSLSSCKNSCLFHTHTTFYRLSFSRAQFPSYQRRTQNRAAKFLC